MAIPYLALAVILMLAIPRADAGSFRLSADQEPDGFRGIKWGEDLSQVEGMKQIGKSAGSGVYTKAGDELSMGGAELDKILYYTINNKFYAVRIYLKEGKSNWEALRADVVKKYGEGYEQGEGNYLYIGKDAGLNLRCNKNAGEYNLSIFSKGLARDAKAKSKQLKQPKVEQPKVEELNTEELKQPNIEPPKAEHLKMEQ